MHASASLVMMAVDEDLSIDHQVIKHIPGKYGYRKQAESFGPLQEEQVPNGKQQGIKPDDTDAPGKKITADFTAQRPNVTQLGDPVPAGTGDKPAEITSSQQIIVLAGSCFLGEVKPDAYSDQH